MEFTEAEYITLSVINIHHSQDNFLETSKGEDGYLAKKDLSAPSLASHFVISNVIRMIYSCNFWINLS